MSEGAQTSQKAGSDGGEGSPIERLRAKWRTSWQIPTLAIAGGLLVSGAVYAFATKPKPSLAPVLDRADALVADGQCDEALDLLSKKVLNFLDDEELPAGVRQRYHLAVARAVYRGQKQLGVDLEQNHRQVISNALEAERQGALLGESDLLALADTYLALGEYTAARVRADQIPDTSSDRRTQFYKRLIDAELAGDRPREDDAMELLAVMLTDAGLAPDDRAWALERQTRIRLSRGYADEAITRLLREMPRLERADPALMGELHLLLGRAYVQIGAWEEGERQLEQASILIPGTNSMHGDVLYHLALIDAERDNQTRAKERLLSLIDRFPDSEFYAMGLLTLAETDALLGEVETAKGVYQQLVKHLEDGVPEAGPTREQVAVSLTQRARERLESGSPADGLSFAEMARQMFPLEEVPVDALAVLAVAHERAARELLGRDDAGEEIDIASIDPSTRAEAQRHLISAATFFRIHADRHILTDNEQYARSLWAAADLFDQAGDRQEAIAAFRSYAEGVPGEARSAEARFRLGRAFQALRDYTTAASYFRELIEEVRAGEGASVGPFADQSYVPLAQVLLADSDESNDEEAEQLLRTVIGGAIGDARTPQYRQALLELGDLLYATGRFERAIELFEEARVRYPETDGVDVIRFRLADAYRQSAKSLEQTLEREAMPESRRREMETLVRERRLAAAAGFEQVRASLEARNPRQRTQLEQTYLRNSYFFLGDLAYEMGDYAEAVRQYDRARERYPSDPASLVAMVQIVNAHLQENDWARARTANERAIRFVESLPDNVWDDPTLPMGRQDWERWLSASSRLYAAEHASTE